MTSMIAGVIAAVATATDGTGEPDCARSASRSPNFSSTMAA